MKSKKHILMIDDDHMLRRLFGGVLAKAGFEVIYASTGDEGRETARRMQPDLILLDINLPGSDGYMTAQRLKEEHQTTDIPVIFLTNQDFTLEAEKAVKEMWVVDYIHKSTDLDEFVQRVKKVLSSARKKNGDAGATSSQSSQ